MMYSVLDHRISPSPPGATVQSLWGNIPHSWVLGFFDRTLEEFLLQLGNLQLPRGGAQTALNLILTVQQLPVCSWSGNSQSLPTPVVAPPSRRPCLLRRG